MGYDKNVKDKNRLQKEKPMVSFKDCGQEGDKSRKSKKE